MSELQQKLRQAAERNSQLNSILKESDYAAPALKQNSSYIADLNAQLANANKIINNLHASTEKERKEHVKIRDSVMRRYASKLQGHKGQEKFSAKQDKEEREFMEAWQKEKEAEQRRDELNVALEQANKEKQSLERDSAAHDEAQKELDQLYQNIFGGPTPEVPGEDDMEQAMDRSREWFKQCEEQLRRDKQAAQALDRTNGRLRQAFGDMQDALGASNIDRFGGGGLWDYMERDALSRAQMNLNMAMQIMEEARRAQPAIEPLSEVNIDHGHFLGDVVFDNIFSDFAQHDRIRASTGQMEQAGKHLQSIITAQKQRVLDTTRQQKEAAQQLLDARNELQRIRAEAFERLGGGDAAIQGDEQLPAYSA